MTQRMNDWSSNMKAVFSNICGAAWPCKESCQQDFEEICPAGWKKSRSRKGMKIHTHCKPGFFHKGPCGKTDMTHFTKAEKQDFAYACSVKWPCGGLRFGGKVFGNKKWQTTDS
eukprot:GHVN01082278.1.p1 GENE.GHVN01082278.1~~GHVN01082278.1.p1  ORF type:complete len:114 (-),score=12.14 GHVN01082278.1:421-762(-)